jgi:hypothetical protein
MAQCHAMAADVPDAIGSDLMLFKQLEGGCGESLRDLDIRFAEAVDLIFPRLTQAGQLVSLRPVG